MRLCQLRIELQRLLGGTHGLRIGVDDGKHTRSRGAERLIRGGKTDESRRKGRIGDGCFLELADALADVPFPPLQEKQPSQVAVVGLRYHSPRSASASG